MRYKLPPIERNPDGSLIRMNAEQQKAAAKLIKKLCSLENCGNCLWLSVHEDVPCPQLLTPSVCCKFFRHVLLKEKIAAGLEAEIFKTSKLRYCESCGKAYSARSNNAKYCPDCRPIMDQKRKTDFLRRKRLGM